MYFVFRELLSTLFERHIWMDVELITETRKAILIRFDGRKEWIPKVWISSCKRGKGRFIKIKISESHWAKKFQ